MNSTRFIFNIREASNGWIVDKPAKAESQRILAMEEEHVYSTIQEAVKTTVLQVEALLYETYLKEDVDVTLLDPEATIEVSAEPINMMHSPE